MACIMKTVCLGSGHAPGHGEQAGDTRLCTTGPSEQARRSSLTHFSTRCRPGRNSIVVSRIMRC